ncbi:MAG TPA: glycoside hydrolase family 99-like domain-containing protein [Candidatus Desulfovibrio intestinavium]|uniref:Glycoside hydrolase family 99-like domain-containing protein n=1 Tax=Candidatus Desulfovibrio intestinavium TaxID=2838534 RepID=A0A9D2KQH0_9BACT|nr:glycoside hydrolase family 99-like domain-containing protein [Candidatus Desulfovibrio intestinavium]
MKCLAFYLPQFHAIPENDAVYGKGFTEWDNVRAARPLFPGHEQPQAPHPRLGWYNLLDGAFLERQHALAHEFGVTGFCYYYYNMAGKRLLEKPLERILANRHIRNEFCLCWAHVSWFNNRQGPGAVFLPQTYDAAQARQLAEDVLTYFEHPRHIRINGRPLFLFWAPERLPLVNVYADMLREAAHRRGFPGVFLMGVEAYAASLPQQWGLDAMLEFAPDWRPENQVSAPDERPRRMDYARTLTFMRQKPVPPYLRLRSTFPGWDNTPRRGASGMVCTGTSVELFRRSLIFLTEYTRRILPPELQYVFINAWNEWGEGCHIEPDARHGFAHLQAVRDMLRLCGAGAGLPAGG